MCFNMIFVRIKQCKFENASREKQKLIIFLKNGRVVKFNWFFLKPHKIRDYRQKFYLLYKSMIKKKKKNHDKIAVLAKYI